LDINRTEQEQIEAIQAWWAENGKAVIAGIILGLAAIFGWRGYQSYQQSMLEAASDLYTNMIIEMRDKKNDKARDYGNQLLNEYPRTTYATYASLTLAALDVTESKPEEAINHLRTVLDQSGDDSLKHLARLRLARILLGQDKTDEALSLLDVGEEGAFAPSYAELRGDIYARQGKSAEARAAYQITRNQAGKTAGTTTSFLQMKIDDLGRPATE